MPVALLLLQTTCLPPLSPLPPVSLSSSFFFRPLFARETKKTPNNNFNNQSRPDQTRPKETKQKQKENKREATYNNKGTSNKLHRSPNSTIWIGNWAVWHNLRDQISNTELSFGNFEAILAVNVDRFLKDFFSRFPSVLLSSSPPLAKHKRKQRRRSNAETRVRFMSLWTFWSCLELSSRIYDCIMFPHLCGMVESHVPIYPEGRNPCPHICVGKKHHVPV